MYEVVILIIIKLEKGKVYEVLVFICIFLFFVKVGDYYYSDVIFFSEKNENKICIGIVYVLDDVDGNFLFILFIFLFGCIVVLGDN